MITDRTAHRQRNPWRFLLRSLLVTGWVLVLLAGVAYGALVELSGDSYCPIEPNSSTYGTQGWSVVPPGPTCTFTAEQRGVDDVISTDEVRGPTPVMSIWLGVLGLGVAALVLFPRPRGQHAAGLGGG